MLDHVGMHTGQAITQHNRFLAHQDNCSCSSQVKVNQARFDAAQQPSCTYTPRQLIYIVLKDMLNGLVKARNISYYSYYLAQ